MLLYSCPDDDDRKRDRNTLVISSMWHNIIDTCAFVGCVAQVWNRKGIAWTVFSHTSTSPDTHCHSETVSNPACFSIHSLLLGRTKKRESWLSFDWLEIWFVSFVLLHSLRLWVMPAAHNNNIFTYYYPPAPLFFILDLSAHVPSFPAPCFLIIFIM